MKSRSTRVRTKVVALLLSLFALWSFAAFVTVREGLNLLWVKTLDDKLGRPTETLIVALQQERRLSLVYLGGGEEAQRRALADQRIQTDEIRARFQELAQGTAYEYAAGAALEALVAEENNLFPILADVRRAVDARAATATSSAERFNELIDGGFRIYRSLASLDDPELAKEANNLVSLSRARETLSREDALLAGAAAGGGFATGEHTEFVQLVGTQRFLYDELTADLRPEQRAAFEQFYSDSAYKRFESLEDQVVNIATDGKPLPVSVAEWNSAVDPVTAKLRQLESDAADATVVTATDRAVGTIIRLALAGGLGLIAVIASIVISITTARNLVRQLERLRNAARDLASYRLPRVVERLQHGERVDVDAEAPPLDFGRDEIGQVGEAFNQVQETAIRVAVEQAELRRSVRDVFLSLARRSQALLHRQLGLLDAMERRATDSEELAELFRIDHLATRMRRNAENLIVLSGATAGRAWRKPVAMVDVLRGALAEVEDYTRVTVLPVGSASLLGRAVGDVIHLLAELIENAVSFSPPQTVVRVGGSVVGYGFAIEIEDRGLGMSQEELESANEQLRNPPEFRLTSTARLGLYVVGKLAERHGIKVRLTESPYGGTTAIVLLPGTLMADDGSADDPNRVELEPVDDSRSVQLAGVGRHRLEAEAAAIQTDPAALAGTGPYGPTERPAIGNDRTGTDTVAPDFVAPDFVEPDIVAPGTNGSRNGHGANGFVTATPALTPVTPIGGTPAVTPAITPAVTPTVTPNGLPTRPVPSQPTGPSTMDSAVAPLATPAPMVDAGGTEPATSPVEPPRLTPSGLPWRQRPAPPPEPAASTMGGPSATAPTATGSTSSTDPTGWSAIRPGEAGPSGDAIPPRGPDQTRSLMASYRSGTLRGRSEAARLAESPPAESSNAPQWTEAPSTEPGATLPGTAEPPAASTPTSEWTESTSDPRKTEEEG